MIRARGAIQCLPPIEFSRFFPFVGALETSVKLRWLCSNSWIVEDEDHGHQLQEKQITPWVRSVASGVDLLRNPKYNKGMAFTEEERSRHYLHGLLPPAFNSQEMQVQRVLSNLREYSSDLQKYVHLMSLQERNERLFYRVVMDHIEEILPIIYTPTVGLVCQKYGLMFRRPRGLFISTKDRGRIMEILKNWPERRVRAIVVTDGERVLGMGDLGVQGMGIPVAKLAVYVACGGIHPAECLPVCLDVGTNNVDLLRDPMYPGLRQRRVTGEAYDELVDEFMEAAKDRYGSDVLIQFEDFANHNAFRLLFQYRGSHLVFNDEIQGIAAVTVAGIMASLPIIGGQLASHTYLFSGAGEASASIAELLATAIRRETKGSLEEARERIWFLDDKGLVVRERADVDTLPPHILPFAHSAPAVSQAADLTEAVKVLRPSVLLAQWGASVPPSLSISHSALSAMAAINQRPVIFALAPTTDQDSISTAGGNSELTAQQVYDWTQGRCLFVGPSPSPADDQSRPDSSLAAGSFLQQGYRPPQGSTVYIFPGVALGCHISACTRLRDEMLIAAAEGLASQVTDADLETGHLYPPLWKIREVTAHVARAVAGKAYDFGLASRLPRPPDLLALASAYMYNPQYRPLR